MIVIVIGKAEGATYWDHLWLLSRLSLSAAVDYVAYISADIDPDVLSFQ